jgi:hypothetical protein
MICRTPRDLWKKFKERIYSVNWHWVDVETLRDEMRSLGHEAEILAPPQHLQFGCKAYATRVDLKLRKKPS